MTVVEERLLVTEFYSLPNAARRATMYKVRLMCRCSVRDSGVDVKEVERLKFPESLLLANSEMLELRGNIEHIEQHKAHGALIVTMTVSVLVAPVRSTVDLRTLRLVAVFGQSAEQRPLNICHLEIIFEEGAHHRST